MKKILLFIFLINMVACQPMAVQPWQKSVLAREDMALDSNAMEAAFDDHIYFSKEASSGGSSFSGGGCGCN